MKRTMTLALAASIFILTMAATPHHALAASNAYLTIDSVGQQSSSTPPQQTTFLSFAVNAASPFLITLPTDGRLVSIFAIWLPNAGTYVIGGQQVISNFDMKFPAQIFCELTDASDFGAAPPVGSPVPITEVLAESSGTLPLNGFYIAKKPTTLEVACAYGGPDGGTSTWVQTEGFGSLTAIQVQ